MSKFNVRTQAGFTIIEVLLVLVMIGALINIAAPTVTDLSMNARMTSQANDVMTDLGLARSEAVKRGVRTAICTSTNGTSCTNSAWNLGWIVFLDSDGNGAVAVATDVLKRVSALDGGNTVTSTGHSTNAAGAQYVPFRPSGTTTPGGGTITFTLCDSRTVASVGAVKASQKARLITLTATGRASVARHACP